MSNPLKYLEPLIILALAAMSFYFAGSGWITGEIYFPAYLSGTDLVSLTDNPTGFYIALALWSAFTVLFCVFGVQNLEKVKRGKG